MTKGKKVLGIYDFSDVEFVMGMVVLNASSKTKRTPNRLDTLVKMIAANARADERERCESVCWAEHKKAGNGSDGAYRLERAILAIRNMGD